jgi:hypothetical protein
LRRYPLQIEGRIFALQLVFEGEIDFKRLVGFAMAQEGSGFARIVIAVVIEEDNLTADFGLEPLRRPDFGGEKPFRKESARLLTEADDWGGSHGTMGIIALNL